MKNINKKIDGKNSLESYLYSVKSTLSDEKTKLKFSDDDKTDINVKLAEVQNWLDSVVMSSVEKSEFESKQKELESVFNPIMQRVYKDSAGTDGSDGSDCNIPSMPNGMPPGFTPEQMAQAEEMMRNLTPEQREEMMKKAQQSMGGMSGQSSQQNPSSEPKIEEID